MRIAGEDRGILTKVKDAVSIPSTIDMNSKRHIAFSLFDTAAVSLPFVTTVVFWLVLHRSNTSFEPNAAGGSLPVDQAEEAYSFGGRFLKNFLVINLNAVNSVIALVKILVLSSARKQKVKFWNSCVRPSPQLTRWQHSGTHLAGLLAIIVL